MLTLEILCWLLSAMCVLLLYAWFTQWFKLMCKTELLRRTEARLVAQRGLLTASSNARHEEYGRGLRRAVLKQIKADMGETVAEVHDREYKAARLDFEPMLHTCCGKPPPEGLCIKNQFTDEERGKWPCPSDADILIMLEDLEKKNADSFEKLRSSWASVFEGLSDEEIKGYWDYVLSLR